LIIWLIFWATVCVCAGEFDGVGPGDLPDPHRQRGDVPQNMFFAPTRRNDARQFCRAEERRGTEGRLRSESRWR